MTLPPYETSDVYLASYLICQGATLVETKRVGPRRTMFRFVSDAYLHALLRTYWSNDQILVTPTRLFDALRKLKSRIRKKPVAAAGDAGDMSAIDDADRDENSDAEMLPDSSAKPS